MSSKVRSASRALAATIAVSMVLPALLVAPPAAATLPANGAAAFYAAWSMDKDRNGLDDALDRDLAEGATGTVLLHVHYGHRPGESDAALLRDAYGAERTYVFRNWDDIKVETTYDRVALMRTAPGVVAVEKFEPPRIELDTATKGTRARQAEGVPVVDGFDHLLAVHETLGYRGEGMVIAVLDTGVDNLHESLDDLDDDPATNDPKRVQRIDPVTGLPVPAAADVEDGFNVLECIDPIDNGAHGTHVAGIALGTGGPTHEFQGVAPQARLVEVDIAPVAVGIGMDLGFDWVMSYNRGETCYGDPGEDRIDVVTLSFGMSGGDNPESSTQLKYTDVARSGMTSIVSAGNSGSGPSTLTKGPEGLIVVADVDDANTVVRSDDAISSTSSRGPRVSSDGDLDPLDNLMPHISAPGTDILSAAAGTLGQYVGLSGTSMAAPHIAGVAALMLQANPALRPLALEHDRMGDPGSVPIRDVMIKTAQAKTAAQGGDPQASQTGRFGLPWNNAWGYGLVDAYAAVQYALQPGQLIAGAGSAYTCVVGEPCELRAEASGGTAPYSFAWQTGDGGAVSGAVVLHTYAAEGDFTATVTVTDSAGASDGASALVRAREAGNLGIVGDLARAWTFDGADGACDAQGWISRSGRFVSVGLDKQYASTGGSQWHLQGIAPASAPCAWYHGLDATRTYTDLGVTQLDSPAGQGCLFLPPGTSGATLTFRIAGETERGFDQLLVMYQPGPCIPDTPDNFASSAATFVELAMIEGAVGDLHADPPLYEERIVSLAPLVQAGNGNFQLRFRFYSDIAVNFEGVQLDDVKLYAKNAAPTIAAPGDLTVQTTDDVAFTVAVADPDGDPTTLAADGLPAGATFDAATGALAWSPGDEQEGVHVLRFVATDGLWTVSEEVVVTVLNVPPVAAGSAGSDQTDRLTAVQFTDASTDADGTIAAWLWDFGDGTTSGEQNPSHTYASLGNKVVTLTVTDDDGAASSVEVGRVKVKNIPPKARASGPDGAGDAGSQAGEGAAFTANRVEPLALTDASTDADGQVVAWAWDLGDGATSDARNPSHQYAALGTFAVAQTARDNDGDAGEAGYLVEVVNLLPKAGFAHDPAHPITLVPVQFEDLSADRDGQVVAWAWDFGDGATSDAQDPLHVFLEGGWHRVALRVTDSDGGVAETARDMYVCTPGVDVAALAEPGHQHLAIEGCVALGGDEPLA